MDKPSEDELNLSRERRPVVHCTVRSILDKKCDELMQLFMYPFVQRLRVKSFSLIQARLFHHSLSWILPSNEATKKHPRRL